MSTVLHKEVVTAVRKLFCHNYSILFILIWKNPLLGSDYIVLFPYFVAIFTYFSLTVLYFWCTFGVNTFEIMFIFGKQYPWSGFPWLIKCHLHETTLKNHGNQPKTMKNNENTLKNHENQPKTKKPPWKPWKPTKNHEKPWKLLIQKRDPSGVTNDLVGGFLF